jgi:hydroxypyruvate reductase
MDGAASPPARRTVEAIYAAAVAGAMPHPATAAAVGALELALGQPVRLIALGKAAAAMADAAAAGLAARKARVAGGVVVAPEACPAPDPLVTAVVGDHPIPGGASAEAARRIGEAVARVGPADSALVLLSGGASSLAAAPVAGVQPNDLAWLYQALLGVGADITAVNAVRKRFARWSGGRLAAALAPTPIDCLIVSDVLGDDAGTVASGPCAPDPLTAADVRARLGELGLWKALPASMRRYLADVRAGRAPETPKPGDPAFARVRTRVIVSNAAALRSAAERARALGVRRVVVDPEPLAGDAAACGERLARALLAEGARRAGSAAGTVEATCMIWGGEPTVTLGDAHGALGGRAQELALAAARALHEAGAGAAGLTLLAAGTDRRDGPTDAAGAVVDGATWDAVRRAGRDPAADLAAHRSYLALDAAGSLLRPGLTGTNVMDVVVGLMVGRQRAGSRA